MSLLDFFVKTLSVMEQPLFPQYHFMRVLTGEVSVLLSCTPLTLIVVCVHLVLHLRLELDKSAPHA